MSARLVARGAKLRPSTRFKMRLPQKQVDPFYTSPEWRALVDDIKQERWPQLLATRGHCCEDPDCTARHTSGGRIFFDHLLERRDRPDLALVKANILGRCGASHSKKTAAARAKRLQVLASAGDGAAVGQQS